MASNKRRRPFAVIAALILQPLATAATSPRVTAPISKWNMDWTKTTCTLRRVFGTVDKPSLLIFERFGPTDTFQFTVISNEFRNFEQGGLLLVRYGDRAPVRVESAMLGRTKDGKASLFIGTQLLTGGMDRVFNGWIPSVTPAAEAATTSISVKYLGHEQIFQTGPMNAAFDAMRQCTDDLVKSWGLDPKQQATLTKRAQPINNPSKWLGPSDYPQAMSMDGKQALISFRLSIDDKGVPTACEIQRSYNDKMFDEVTCAAFLKRARFTPALDAKGVAIPSYYISSARWVLDG